MMKPWYALIYLWPLLWTSLILYASTPTFAASETSGRMAWWWFYLFPESPAGLFEIVHLLVRKMAHVTEYGCLTLGWLVAWQVHFRQIPRWGWVGAGLWGLAVASLDEWRQAQWLSRTGTWLDVVVDMVGVLLVLGLYRSFRRSLTREDHPVAMGVAVNEHSRRAQTPTK